MKNKINKNKKFNYYENELNSLNIKENDPYKPIIKIHDSKGNATKHLSITFEQYQQIKKILISK